MIFLGLTTLIFWVLVIELALLSPRLYYALLLILFIPLSGFSTYTVLSVEGTTFSVLGRSFLVVLIVATVLSLVQNRSHLPRGRPLYLLGIFLTWLIVKSVDSTNISESVSALLQYVLVACVLLLSAVMVRLSNQRYVLGCIACSALLPMLIGLLQLMLYYSPFPSWEFLRDNITTQNIGGYSYPQITSIFTHANVFAHFMALNVVVFIMLSSEKLLDSRLQWPVLVTSIVMVVFIIFLATRGAMLVLLLGTAFAVVRRLRLSTILFVVGTILALYFLSDQIEHSFVRMTRAESQWTARTEIWRIGLQSISLTGIGLSEILTGKIIPTDKGYLMAHNDYLKYLVETGLIGMSLFAFFLLDVLSLGYQDWRSQHEMPSVRVLAALVLVSWMVFAVAMVAENLQFLNYFILPFSILGAFCGTKDSKDVVFS